MERYPARAERRMQALFRSLSEKDRRRYAAVEADKLGHGGTKYIAKLFGIDAKTIRRGRAELDLPQDPAEGRVRKNGGGRKRTLDVTPEVEQTFLGVVREHTAGSPQHEVRWTNLKQQEIADRVSAAGIPISRRIVRQLLRRHEFVKRKALKKSRTSSTRTATPSSSGSPN